MVSIKSLDELLFDNTVRYSAEHIWLKKTDDAVAVGISDYAQDQLGDLIFIDLIEIGDFFSQGEVFGFVESAKTASDL